MPRDDLEDGADDIAHQAEGDGLLAAQLVAQGEGKDGSAESTELHSHTYKLTPLCDQQLVRVGRRTEKQLDVIPEMFACFVSGNQYLKSDEINTPEKTP